jgi:photosystem II stability/assembly factor-like uncharacterized protein
MQNMKTKLLLLPCLLISFFPFAQNGWKVTNTPGFAGRVDDIFMVNTQTGYAVSGDGKIVKSTDGGENWSTLLQNTSVYCRAVEFINTQKGFVGGFPNMGGTTNILRRTTDGGATWTDLTPLIPQRSRQGICGIAVADANTIYAGGNWFRDSAYIIKSVDGGDSWSLIDMSMHATSIIDLHFVNKDTGFATGKGLKPLESAVIFYTTNGGQTWTNKYMGTTQKAFVWKFQRLTKRILFASVEDLTPVPAKVLKSVDGGMNWLEMKVSQTYYDIEGIGFIDPLHGWTGGSANKSFETKDGGVTWDSVAICPFMNRVFKVNDTMMFASGNTIWKYKGEGIFPPIPTQRYAQMVCYPNPVKDVLTIDVSLARDNRVWLVLLDGSGRQVKMIENADRNRGSYQYYVNTAHLPEGMYYVILKTHDDKGYAKIVVSR